MIHDVATILLSAMVPRYNRYSLQMKQNELKDNSLQTVFCSYGLGQVLFHFCKEASESVQPMLNKMLLEMRTLQPLMSFR